MLHTEMKIDWARGLLVALLLGFLGYGAWHWSAWQRAGETGAAYAARITCSCRYVGGRDAKSCAQDISADAWMASVSEVPEEKAVRASVPLLGSARAVFRPGFGCLLEKEAGL